MKRILPLLFTLVLGACATRQQQITQVPDIPAPSRQTTQTTGEKITQSTAPKPFVRRMRIKSRNFTSSGVDYVFTLSVRSAKELCGKLEALEGAQRFSLIEYDSEDIV